MKKKELKEDIRKKVNQMSIIGLGALAPTGTQQAVVKDVTTAIAKTSEYAYKTTRHKPTSQAIDDLVKEWFTTPAPKGVKKEMIMPKEKRA